MKNLTTALLFFCAFNLTNATAASAPGGVPASDLLDTGAAAAVGGRAYFPDHDYLKYTPKEMLPQIVQELHGLLTASAKKLGTLSKYEHEDLLWAVSSRSTNANTVNCLLGESAGFDKICQSIFDKLEALKARAFSPLEISELQKEIEQAANVVSKALVDSTDHKSKK